MTHQPNNRGLPANSPSTLRERAEDMLRTSRTDVDGLRNEDVQKLIHELQVHQIELQMQNEELRNAQVELAESRDRFSDLYDFAPVGYLTLDKEGLILEANLTAATLLGVERQSLRGAKFANFVARRSQDDYYRHRSTVFSSDAKQVCELEMRSASAPTLTLRMESIAFDSQQASHRECRTALIDITESKRAEEAVRDREARLAAILNTANDAIITIDERGIITAANPATERMFGYSQAELNGLNVSMLMPPPYRDEHNGYIARYLRTGEAKIIGIGRELVGLRKNGSTFPADLAVSRIDHLGLFTGFIRDVTERKVLQKHILEIANKEKRRIGRELHDGTQQELIGLTLIAGTLRDALTSLPERKAKGRTIRQIHEPLYERLCAMSAALSQNLSDASRHVRELSHGIMPVQIDAEGLGGALERLSASTNGLNGMTCGFECPFPVNIPNNTTATHLYRIAQEAVNNALRHSQADHIQILLQQENGQILLEISDNGAGITLAAPGIGIVDGMGLRTMEYRAGIIGGLLTIDHATEGGTRVRCTVSAGGANDPSPNSGI